MPVVIIPQLFAVRTNFIVARMEVFVTIPDSVFTTIIPFLVYIENDCFCKTPKTQECVEKMKSMEMTEASKIEIVPCDEKSFCLDGNTCCPLASGAYGCCKWPSAVCCPDKRAVVLMEAFVMA
ncbi:granulin [Trichonephila clavata]|uniref:Granulin n=1 Tax=Trichonephila clavata TaxID=2740835 RepID=A0A8X6M414_TRICU|nr:granulin [Trichonephila clavata]